MVDSNLHSLFAADAVRDDTSVAPQRTLLFIAIGASVILHTVIAGTLLQFTNHEQISAAVTSVNVRLIPSNPLRTATQHPAPDLEDSAIALDPVIESNPQSEDRVVQPETLIAETVERVGVEEEGVQQKSVTASEILAELAEPRSIPAELPVNHGLPLITLPSIQAMQQATQAVSDADAARSWMFECNLLQEEDGLHTCERASEPDYQSVLRSPSYEALNPVREFSRSARTSKSVYQNAGVAARALESSSVPVALREYLVSELEAGTSLYTNNGTSNEANMRRMTDKSAAAQQAARVLGDSWVRGRAVELQHRQVRDN